MCWQVLHCVLYPRLEYDVPILSLDMVGNEAGGVSLAIVDVCPCVVEGHLPLAYQEAARQALLASLRADCGQRKLFLLARQERARRMSAITAAMHLTYGCGAPAESSFLAFGPNDFPHAPWSHKNKKCNC